MPVPAYSRDAQRNIAVHAAKLHRPPTKMVEPPPAPRAGAFRARKPRQTNFSRRYRCGDLPVSVDHGHSKPAIRWLVEPQRLDLHYYLPLFFDGLRETRFPESMLARQGVVTLMEMGGEDCVSIVGKLIQPIKGAPHPAHTPAAVDLSGCVCGAAALNTRDPSTIILTLNTVGKLVNTVHGVGTALLPYYKTILPLINGFKNKTRESSSSSLLRTRSGCESRLVRANGC